MTDFASIEGYDNIVPFRRVAQDDDTDSYPVLRGDGGGGTSGGVTDDWKADVERRLGELRQDVRALLNRGVLAVVALAAMIGGLYLYSNTKFDALNQRLSNMETQQARDSAVLVGKLDLLAERTPAKKH